MTRINAETLEDRADCQVFILLLPQSIRARLTFEYSPADHIGSDKGRLTASARFEHSDWSVKPEGSAEDLAEKAGTNTFAAVNVDRRTASTTGKHVTYFRCVAGVQVSVVAALTFKIAPSS